MVFVGVTAPPAQAESPGNIQADPFEPQYGQGTAILNTLKTDLIPHLNPTGGLFFHVSNGLIEERRVDADGNETVNTLIGDSFKLELQLGLGLFDWFDIGIMVPLVLSQDLSSSEALSNPLSGDFSVQDPRIGLRVRLLHPDQAYGLGIGLSANIYIPAGSKDEYNFTSDGDVRFEPRLIIDYRHEDSQFAIAANFGFQMRPERVLQNVVNGYGFRWYLATEIPLGVDGLHIISSVYGTLGLSEDKDPGNLAEKAAEARNSPIELDAGLQYAWKDYNLVFNAGGGAGLVSAVGAPAWRAFFSVSYTPLQGDRDGDGILDSDDKCPKVPEDKDAFEDDDGCPDLDNDKDGIVDTKDKCPMKPEDKDGYEDTDGCPDPDNDDDGILDKDDKCPRKPEDKDNFEDKDGCPDYDNDQDGIFDVKDKCPMVKEDMDGFEDLDGCPDPDNDQDGIPDVKDKCPLSKETKNNYQDEDGCPDVKPKKNAKVQVTKKYVTIKGKIQFATAKAKIKKKSFKLLDEVAQVLIAYPQITKLRIEGHTDDRGSAGYNRRLSGKRAKSVRTYLIGAGVADKRLQAVGYGEDRPKVPNTSRKNRAVNRRVEFFILEVDGKPVGDDAKVEEKTE